MLALEQSILFADERKIEVGQSFTSLLVDLVSRRPNVFAEALDTFGDLRSLTVQVVYGEFARLAKACTNGVDAERAVDIRLYQSSKSISDATTAKIPLPLVRSVSVLLSMWKDEYRTHELESSVAVDSLVSSLMCADPAEKDGKEEIHVSPKKLSEQSKAVPVESVSREGLRRFLARGSTPLTRLFKVDYAC